ncbi:NAD(P)/FAD-dependent oxidoreductase [Parashewanella curva]|uniref:NAD(P)/FAD-dependent oxidoreductase n=1 Tax=Parashewanella curva TaxID=2338552 RepID=A0A3L8PYV1_9GAMM|nr:NAD(P)/FAD-dependent oxidoreductase [Parashewanella curva]RLV60531.1 NAD(P)/FAD-dependent oxidoreductase [Parashewanella curva]
MIKKHNQNSRIEYVDVVIIGAGPSGAIAASLLHKQQKKVVVIEKQQFPRFSIGESLLPHCMSFIEEAGMLDAVNKAGFQFKNGAAFQYQKQHRTFDFTQKFSQGHGTTFQVQRGSFDKLLADTASEQGVEIRYGHSVLNVKLEPTTSVIVTEPQGTEYTIRTKYILDASGFGRVLPKLLDLEVPSDLPPRTAIFTHVYDHISDSDFDRDKILISVHPQHQDIWYWLIPFNDGRCSVGVVAEPNLIEHIKGDDEQRLLELISQEPSLKRLLRNATIAQECSHIRGYSANVKTLATKKFALLGNAGEFLDPVFSSGVTIAMKSASLAAKVLLRQLNGEDIDWKKEYSQPLMFGVNTFRIYVQAWYDVSFQKVIFTKNPDPKVKQMVCSILAGYAWDKTNPFVADAEKRLSTLVQLCELQEQKEMQS